MRAAAAVIARGEEYATGCAKLESLVIKVTCVGIDLELF